MPRRSKKKILAGCLTLTIAAGMIVAWPKLQPTYTAFAQKQKSGELEQALRLAVFNGAKDPATFDLSTLPEGYLDSATERAKRPEFKVVKAGKPTGSHFAAPARDQWWHSFGDSTSAKYADAPDLTPDTVGNLNRAWVYDTPDHQMNIQATPIFTGRLIVFPDAQHHIVAVEPDTGKVVWRFDPQIPQPAKRGLITFESNGTRKIAFVAGGRIFVLNADTGQPDVGFGRSGSKSIGYTTRVAPQTDGDTIYVASLMPAIHAYDLKTGRHKWTTDLFSSRVFASTFSRFFSDSSILAGANPWGGLSFDPDRKLIFTTLSNPTPVAKGALRPGPNRPANSVVAINTTDGSVAWIFQEIEHDLWDLDVAAPPVLASIDRDGAPQDVVAVPTKAGNLMLLYRDTGQPVFDWWLRKAPTSTIKGEYTAPYQPDPILPKPFAKMAFTTADFPTDNTNISDTTKTKLSTATTGFYAPHVPNKDTIFFGLHGGAMHTGAALDPATSTLVIAASHVPNAFALVDENRTNRRVASLNGKGAEIYTNNCSACHGSVLQGGSGPALTSLNPALRQKQFNRIVQNGLRSMPAVDGLSQSDLSALYDLLIRHDGVTFATAETDTPTSDAKRVRTAYQKIVDDDGYPASKPPWGTLTAVDLNTGLHKWRIPLGRYQALKDQGIPPTGTENLGGPTIVSGGVIFVSGTKDRKLHAIDLRTGNELWSDDLPYIGSASPMVYRYGGASYVLIPATGGGTLALYDPTVQTGGSFIAYRLSPE